MNRNPAAGGTSSTTNWKSRLPTLLAIVLLVGIVGTYGGLATASTSTTQTSFVNVQVSIHTTYSLPSYSYSVSAYNTTGGLVASYQSQYPAAAFELPSGAYIFTASASQQGEVYPIPVDVTSGSAGSPTTSTSSGSTATICCVYSTSSNNTKMEYPCCTPYNPQVEYGYVSQQISGPTSLTISTRPLNATSQSTLTISVNFPNGKPAAGVYVSASILGDVNGWAYGTGALSLSSTTSKQGLATLLVPSVPVLVTAETSVPVVLPQNQTTFTVNVDGQAVNVTAVWQPSYLSFSGHALVLPPQTSASITLRYQEGYPGPIPLGVAGQSTTVATGVASPTPASSPALAQSSVQQQSSPAQTTGNAASEDGSGPSLGLGLLALVGVALALALGATFVVRTRSARSPKPAAALPR